MCTNIRKIIITLADETDRQNIYALRHRVYASELGQHAENAERRLTDPLDAINCYLIAKIADEIVGFVSITPPSGSGYSIDKYFSREELPLIFNDTLYEVRLLTVLKPWRSSFVAASLLYGALCYIESRDGQTIVAIGRLEVLAMYQRAGLRSLGRQVRSGQVTYELMSADTCDLRNLMARFHKLLIHFQQAVDWRVADVHLPKKTVCFHGGNFFEAIGNSFDDLSRKETVINADVLDAWFDPAPNVVAVLAKNLSWLLKTSPPTAAEGMRRVLADARGVREDNILPGAGSSDLIFLGLRHWLSPRSRVLILDPMYGEYAHVLENIVGCRVDRLTLSRNHHYAVEIEALKESLKGSYDWVILVNPNSPTGQHVNRLSLEAVIAGAPKTTRFWIDETYIDYVDSNQSLEGFAAQSKQVVICKSMSKVYALSGVRCAYLCGPAHLIDELKVLSPPWSVSLPGQMAACEALRNLSYYRKHWAETHQLREDLARNLAALGWDIVPGCANFLLCHLPVDHPEASILIQACRKHSLYLRDISTMGRCFDRRSLRIAVKDTRTNEAMVGILQSTLATLC